MLPEKEIPWTYGLYSATIVRFNNRIAAIFRRDTMEWQDILEPSQYRRIVEECDLLSSQEAQEMIDDFQKSSGQNDTNRL